MISSSGILATSRFSSDLMMPCPLITLPSPRSQAASTMPCRARQGRRQRPPRAGVGHPPMTPAAWRDQRIELAEAAQHPVLPHRLVVARDPHRAEQFLGDVDLPGAVNALIFAAGLDDVALDLGAGDHLLHVAAAHLLEQAAREHVDMPGLGVHRGRRALGAFDDRLDHRARHRLVLETTHAATRRNQRFNSTSRPPCPLISPALQCNAHNCNTSPVADAAPKHANAQARPRTPQNPEDPSCPHRSIPSSPRSFRCCRCAIPPR